MVQVKYIKVAEWFANGLLALRFTWGRKVVKSTDARVCFLQSKKDKWVLPREMKQFNLAMI